MLLAGAIALSATGLVGWSASRYVQHNVVEGEIHVQEEALARTPCGREAIVALVTAHSKASNPRGAVTAAEAFLARCGPFPRLSFYTYGARMLLHEYDRAVADATTLIESDPEDKDYRWWRGQAYEEAGTLDKAAADYQFAISIQPRLMRIPMNLATVYEKMHRPCDALFTLEQYTQRYPAIRSNEGLSGRMRRLDEEGQCERIAGAGRAVIRFPPGARGILVTARLNHRAAGRFIVDTGATTVMFSRRLAGALGIAWDSAATVLVGTAGGVREAQMTTLDAIELQGLSAERVPAAIGDELPPGIDGLLGLSFLSRFSMFLDEGQGTLELAARPGAKVAAAPPVQPAPRHRRLVKRIGKPARLRSQTSPP